MTNQEKENLASEYLPKLKILSKKMTKGFPGREDEAFSVGLVAVCEALNLFDPTQGSSFSSYASMVSKKRIIDWMRQIPEKEIDQDFNESEIKLSYLVQKIGWDIEYSDWINFISKGLPKRHKELIRLHYLEANYAELKNCANKMGIKSGRAGEIHAEAIEMIKNLLGVSDINSTSNRKGPNRGKSRDKIIESIKEMISVGAVVTIPAVSNRSGLSVACVGSMRKKLIEEGVWPDVDGRSLNGGGYWDDRGHRVGTEHIMSKGE